MVYLVYGGDTEKSLQKFNALLEKFSKKENDFSIFYVNEESFSENMFEELAKTNNLFTRKNMVIGKRLFTNSVAGEYLLKNIKNLCLSNNIFLFWEKELKKEYLDEIKQQTDNITECGASSAKSAKNKNSQSLFRLADLVALRKKQEAWLLYQEELSKGMPADDVFWKIFWQFKSLMIVKAGEGAALAPFVYRKTQNAAGLFSIDEAKKSLSVLLDLYQKNHNGEADLVIGLEKFILKL